MSGKEALKYLSDIETRMIHLNTVIDSEITNIPKEKIQQSEDLPRKERLLVDLYRIANDVKYIIKNCRYNLEGADI